MIRKLQFRRGHQSSSMSILQFGECSHLLLHSWKHLQDRKEEAMCGGIENCEAQSGMDAQLAY